MIRAIKDVVNNIMEYLHNGVYEEMDEIMEKQERDYEKWLKLKKRLPKLIRELETTLARLKEIAE